MNAPQKRLPIRTKTFKSGNSVALRLPKSLGIEAGTEFEIVRDAVGKLLLRRVPEERRNLNELFGSFSDDFMADGRWEADPPARDWSKD